MRKGGSELFGSPHNILDDGREIYNNNTETNPCPTENEIVRTLTTFILRKLNGPALKNNEIQISFTQLCNLLNISGKYATELSQLESILKIPGVKISNQIILINLQEFQIAYSTEGFLKFFLENPDKNFTIKELMDYFKISEPAVKARLKTLVSANKILEAYNGTSKTSLTTYKLVK